MKPLRKVWVSRENSHLHLVGGSGLRLEHVGVGTGRLRGPGSGPGLLSPVSSQVKVEDVGRETLAGGAGEVELG